MAIQNPFLRAALAYAGRLHWPVFPLKPRSKEPLTKHGFQDATLDESQIRAWWNRYPTANVAVPTGIGFWALDIDPRHGGDESRDQLIGKYGALPDTIRQTTGGGGQQYLYLMPDQQTIPCHTAVWPGIDIRGAGGYIVVPPSIHPESGRAYVWDTAKSSILEESLEPAAEWLLLAILGATSHQNNGHPFRLPEKIRKGLQHKTLFKMGAAMRAKGCGYAEILAALWEVNQNRCEEPGPRANIEKLAASIVDRYPAGSKQTEQKTAGPSEPAPDLIPFHFADTGNADRIVALHNRRLRYCYAFRKWLYWDGTRWVTDECGHAIKLVKTSMIAFLRQAVDAASKEAETFARASLDLRRLNAALCLAQSELPIMPGDLDRDLSLLNFNNGVVDLRTGNLSPHRVDHWITKMVHFSYRPDAKCPRWLAFLSEIMGGSDELVDYLQLALGYSITGEASEKAVFVAYGSGDNGKTTLLSVVRELIHEYAVTVGLDLLTTKDSNNNVDAARAKLMGARFASSSETEEGQRLSAARLKRICQGPGGEIEACRKYENPIVFRESHKLWIDANHRPDLPATDAAVWIRLHLIPFTVTIPKDQQDRQLTQLLLGEAEGILAWLVDGAQRWYAEGLSQSKTVSAATAAWRDELNRLAAYLDEHTQKDANDQAYLRNSSLYEAYKSWAEGNGERFLSQPKFTAQMEAMGYRRKREKDGYVWYGIRFK